jgi:hypothetical protein
MAVHIFTTVFKQQQDSVDGSPWDELQKYLQSAIETTTDIPGWWGVSEYLLEHVHT